MGPRQANIVSTADILEDVKRLYTSLALVLSYNKDIVYSLQGGNIRI